MSEKESEVVEEEKCECYSVDPPKYPWISTPVFGEHVGVYDCRLCGRRIMKRPKIYTLNQVYEMADPLIDEEEKPNEGR